MQAGSGITIRQAIARYIERVSLARSENTALTYRKALAAFADSLKAQALDPDQQPLGRLSEDAVAWFTTAMKDLSPSTERLRLTAVAGFYEFLAAEKLAEPNLPRVRLLIRQRGRRPGQRLPQFPRTAIEQVLEHVSRPSPTSDSNEHLRRLRDRAFLLTLADTGLRVHEACKIRRGDVDWDEAQALLVGKGNRQAVVRFSRRALRALRDYLKARSLMDGASGRALTSLPLFARHDRGAGKKVRPITTTTGRTIVHQAVAAALGDEAVGTITPHSFRHYFVTAVLRGSGGNLKLAQELARHRNIAVTQRYAHLSDGELDRGYHEIFDAGKAKESPGEAE